MQREALEKILDLQDETRIPVKFHGIDYTYGRPAPVIPPQPKPLELESLTGLVEYVLLNRDQVTPDDCIIQIVDASTVTLFGRLDPVYKTRPVFATANLSRIFKQFQFNQWHDHEEFMIKLYSLFQPDKDKKLARFIDTVRKAKRIEEDVSEDEKASMKRTQSRGIDIPGDRDAFVSALKPFRTFVEVDQPESQFIFRIRESMADLECALFECDGGAWVNTVRENIKLYLQANLVAYDEKEDKAVSLGIPIFA